jgi:hypothetical protein
MPLVARLKQTANASGLVWPLSDSTVLTASRRKAYGPSIRPKLCPADQSVDHRHTRL